MYLLLFLTLCVALASTYYTEIYDKRFAASLYKELAKNFENFIVSPLLIETAFAAVYLGSSHRTSEEIRTVFHLSANNEEIAEKYKNLLLFFTNRGYKLHIANMIFFIDRVQIVPAWQRQIDYNFGVGTEVLDLINKDATVHKINRWFREQTNNKIDEIVSREDLDAEPSFLLLSALHFQGSWAQKFLKKRTRKDIFYNNGEEKVSVDTMYLLGHFNFGKSENLEAKFLQLFFTKQEASMVIVLPDKIDGIYKLETEIEQVFQFRDFKITAMDISLPKFQMESNIDLNSILRKLGIKVAFIEGKASLHETVTCYKCRSPYISKASQKTYLKINEQGANVETARDFSTHISESLHYEQFKADHPFIFYIKIKEVVVFIGRIVAF
ncbi:leukocyte elastase inhibitor-like [Tribolium madens]|uniref:leukocyte elastase inhibitor-like n=1 Tax=Tribolium madens TaxID=41895 RepID=UPI001CF731F4|nr:leukocyte elastase inhibitor-like [Tribolium madens]